MLPLKTRKMTNLPLLEVNHQLLSKLNARQSYNKPSKTTKIKQPIILCKVPKLTKQQFQHMQPVDIAAIIGPRIRRLLQVTQSTMKTRNNKNLYMRLRQTRSINQPVAQYDSVEQIHHESIPTQRSKNDLHQRDNSEKYSEFNNTKITQRVINYSQSVHHKKVQVTRNLQEVEDGFGYDQEVCHLRVAEDVKEQCNRLLLPAQEPPFNPNVSNSVLKQAYLFPDIAQSGGYTTFSAHQKKKNAFQDHHICDHRKIEIEDAVVQLIKTRKILKYSSHCNRLI